LLANVFTGKHKGKDRGKKISGTDSPDM